MRNVLFVGLPEIKRECDTPHQRLSPLRLVGDGGERRAGVGGGGGGIVVHGQLLLDVGQGGEAGAQAGVAQVDGQIRHGARGRQQPSRETEFSLQQIKYFILGFSKEREKIETWKRERITAVESHSSRNYQIEDEISLAEIFLRSPDRGGSSY